MLGSHYKDGAARKKETGRHRNKFKDSMKDIEVLDLTLEEDQESI